MFGKARQGATAYRQTGIDTGVLGASPHQLIVLLFEGAIIATGTAMAQMHNGDMAGKGKSISHAIEIVSNGLSASLDTDKGGEIAHNLAALYDYIGRQLVAANLKNDPQRLQEVSKLLTELKEAWTSIGQPVRAVLEPAGASA